MVGRSLICLAVAGALVAAGLDPVMAQTGANPKAVAPPAPLIPTSLAIPRSAVPETGTPATGASGTGTPATGASGTGTSETGTSGTGTPATGTSGTGTSGTGTSETGTPRTGKVQIGAPETEIPQFGGLQTAPFPTGAPRATTHHLTPAAAAAKGILVVTTQHPGWGRVSFVLRGNPAPEVRPVPGGIEVHLAPGIHLEMASSAQIRETGPIETRDDDGAAVAVIHLACRCTPEQDSRSGVLHLDIHPDPALQPGMAPGTEAKMAEPASALQAEGARTGVLPEKAGKVASGTIVGPGITSDAAIRSVPEPKPAAAAKTAAAAKPSEAEEMARLRAFLTEKLAKLNATPPQITASPPRGLVSDAASSRPVSPARGAVAPAGDATAQAQPESPADQSGVCLPRVDASGWRGPGPFTERLIALRAQMAGSKAAADAAAALAEFYLANGLGHEAMAAATEALAVDASPEARLRLTRDADIGSLIKGEKLSAGSPLLSNPIDCKRADAALWRDLAAAAEGDAEGAARDPEVAAAALRTLPEPLQRELAFRIVGAVGDNLDALRAMAGAMRNAMAELPEDEARRFLLQARIAGLTHDHAEYAVFLERAARFDMTAPGVIAKARLAAIRAGEGGPAAAHAEAVLIDIARTYRHDALGQQAAEQYAELLLRRHDYAAALAIADESAGPHGPQTRESHGASLVLRILRMLFVDPATTALPEPNERIALYLRYGGYTTPGEKGDDIRLAAARLMLAQHLPDAALDTLHQLSDTGAATPEASQMLATAEAYGGDPAKALDLVKALPDDIAAHRIAAEALRRMRQPLQAAHVLDGAAEFADRARRASLLFEAEAWPDAAAAYAELLRDPLLPAASRNDLATRYALAVAMNGPAANVTAMKLPEAPARLLAAVPSAQPTGQPGLRALRDALQRARHIETLLDPPTAHQGS